MEILGHSFFFFRNTDTVPPEAAERLVASYMSEEQRRRLVSMDPEPLASASVGQVHRGRIVFDLDETGLAVVGKLLAALCASVAAGALFAAVSRRHLKNARLSACICLIGLHDMG